MADYAATHHTSCTVHLSGEFPWETSTHGHGDGAHITVRIGDMLVWFHDQAAVKVWIGEGLDAPQNRFYAKRLPQDAPLMLPERPGRRLVTGGPVTVAVTARHTDTPDAEPRNNKLLIRIGYVNLLVHDQAAVTQLATLSAFLTKLSKLILPRSAERPKPKKR